ncbi:hypothetical protein M3Y99_00278000 [Aphelenchoides fujianensis]|nr:hypothetical protein M3Y99_00278000 [Aphelenchoides fujianensis]
MSSWRQIARIAAVLLLVAAHSSLAVDPLEGIIRDFAYAARSSVQQALNQFSSLRIGGANPNGGGGGFSFQTDTDENERAFRCPLCHAAAAQFLVGTWHVILWSRNFRSTTVADLNAVIDRLTGGRPIFTERNFAELFAETPEIRCPRITIANDREGRTKFELVFQLLNGRQKSIVGQLEHLPDGTFFWRLAPTVNTRLCVAFTNIGNQTNDYDFVVLNQIDSWPSCSNFLALARTRTPDLVNNLRDFLEQQQVEGPLNRMEKIHCPNAPLVVEQPAAIIVPVPSDPFARPPNEPDDPNDRQDERPEAGGDRAGMGNERGGGAEEERELNATSASNGE